MDARDASEQIFKCWQELYPKNSGDIFKSLQSVPLCVWTETGYHQVVGAVVNRTGFVELILDNNE